MKKLSLLILILLTQACAFKDSQLKISHTDDAQFNGPISEISMRSFSSPELEDRREDKVRIGWKKNGYGMNTADITTEQPVQDIVADAIAEGLKANGHLISVNESDIKITGSVERFWFETDINFWTVEFIGEVTADLSFVNTINDEIIYHSIYTGSHSVKKGGGGEKTWRTVMSTAVNKLIEDIVFDEALAEALDTL